MSRSVSSSLATIDVELTDVELTDVELTDVEFTDVESIETATAESGTVAVAEVWLWADEQAAITPNAMSNGVPIGRTWRSDIP